MLSILEPASPAATLIDEVIRLAGRLSSARKMTSRLAGMTPAHWLVLTAICRAPAPPTVARIARSFGHSRQAVRRLAGALAAQGLIAARPDPADRRAPVLVATEAGERAHELADREGAQWTAALTEGIDPAAVAAAAGLLGELRRRLETRARGGA